MPADDSRIRRKTASTFHRAVIWTPTWHASRAGQGLEHLLMGERIADSILLAFEENGMPYRFSYRLRWNADWRIRTARLHVVTELGEKTLSLRSDGAGNWRDGRGRELEELRGAIDVDIWPTPFTNTLPIRRLGDSLRTRQRIDVAWIQAPQLSVTPVRQAYTRLSDRLYRFESIDDGFTADLPVDAEGIVLDYPGLFRRVG